MNSPKIIADYIKPIVKGKSFCDLGCQDGTFISFFKNAGCKKLIAIDKSKNRCAETLGRLNKIEIICDNFFDNLPSAEVYYVFTHTYEAEKIYDLIPNGMIIFSAPKERWEERDNTLKRLDWRNGIDIEINPEDYPGIESPIWTLVIVRKIKSNESTIHIKNGVARKIYSDMYYDFNEKYNRKGEPYFLKKYKSPFFVEMKKEIEGGIKMKDEGVPLGKNKRDENDEYVFDEEMVKKVGRGKIIKWLDGLQKELERLNIEHRDINPSNILYNEKTGELKLIDFTWAIEGIENKEEDERWVAPYPDKKYINILKKQL